MDETKTFLQNATERILNMNDKHKVITSIIYLLFAPLQLMALLLMRFGQVVKWVCTFIYNLVLFLRNMVLLGLSYVVKGNV